MRVQGGVLLTVGAAAILGIVLRTTLPDEPSSASRGGVLRQVEPDGLVGVELRSPGGSGSTPGTCPPVAGRRILMARATDERGRMQPMQRDRDRRDAVISHVLPVEVEIR